MQDLEDFFDLLSLANSNRFDDQRSPAPKILQPKGPVRRAPLDEIGDLGASSFSPNEDYGLKLDNVAPSIAMSMPDLYFGRSAEVRLPSESSQPHDYAPPPHLPLERQSGAGAALEGPVSVPLRRRVLDNGTQGKDHWSSVGASLSRRQRASSLTTTACAYVRANHQKSSSDCGSVTHGEGDHRRNQPALESPLEDEERDWQGRDSPDGKLPSEVSVGDVNLPQRTYPDGAAVRRHQSVKSSSSDTAYSNYKKQYYCDGVRVGWTGSLGRRGSPRSRGRQVSTPISSNRPLRSRRVLSVGDRSQSVEEISVTEDAHSSHILFDAGLGFLSPHSPVVRGVSVPARRDSFSGGRPKLGSWIKPPNSVIQEHSEM